MTKIWQKNNSVELDSIIEKYTSGDDPFLDLEILKYDVLASKAHANMLQKIGIIDSKELKILTSALEEILDLHRNNKFLISSEDEDVHTAIENFLIKKCGDAGKKIHTGRSRNDQVAVALILFQKEKLGEIKGEIKKLVEAFKKLAKKNKGILIPGYSHMRQAMITTCSHWLHSFVESLEDDIRIIDYATKIIDQNPLGSAAGFGTAIGVDREETAKELGFSKVQENTLYCQNSRGKFESLTLEALQQVIMTLSKFSSDLLLFSSEEFGFISGNEKITTGSSIMPQKKNFDVCELIRGNLSVVEGNKAKIIGIFKGLMSGYSRDFQLIKKPLIESTNITLASVKATQIILENISFNEAKILEKISPEILAADIANEMVKTKKVPFRDAYKMALEKIPEKLQRKDLEKFVKEKNKKGEPGYY